MHIGIATQTDDGLMVPVLRHAEALDLWASAAEIARLAEAARDGKAAREELTGSTITITSLGALGGIVTTPVINHPEVAIVGANRIVERPVVRGGQIVPRQDDEPVLVVRSPRGGRLRTPREFVQALQGAARTPGDAVCRVADERRDRPTLLVIGGGPGGYVAAIRAASSASTPRSSKATSSAAPA